MSTLFYYSLLLLCSDEDDGDTLDWLPMAPEIEDPEEPGWGQLEVNQSWQNKNFNTCP